MFFFRTYLEISNFTKQLKYTVITVRVNDKSLTKNEKKPILRVWQLDNLMNLVETFYKGVMILRVWQLDNLMNRETAHSAIFQILRVWQLDNLMNA